MYVPTKAPTNPTEIPRFIERELTRISDGFRTGSLNLPKTYEEPPKPNEGDLFYADGTSWNPGSGQGIYQRRGLIWQFIA